MMNMSLCSTDVDPIEEGTLLDSRYQVLSFLGEGSFGKVAKCMDTKTMTKLAIKITKDDPRCAAQAVSEMRMLAFLQNLDPDKWNLVKWSGAFFHSDYICLKFELLDLNLRDYMQQRDVGAMVMSELKPVLHQLTSALVHLEDLRIIHADIKPDNIMVVDRRQATLRLKIVDFGLACHTSEVIQGTCLQTLWYRAPEVMLGMIFSEPIDMWSLGLVAAELAMGYPMFPGNHEYDMMRFIVSTLGQPPNFELNQGEYTYRFFKKVDQTWQLKTLAEFEASTGHLYKEAKCFHSPDQLKKWIYFLHEADMTNAILFMDLLERMLDVDQYSRIIPFKIHEHPFFSNNSTTNILAEPPAGVQPSPPHETRASTRLATPRVESASPVADNIPAQPESDESEKALLWPDSLSMWHPEVTLPTLPLEACEPSEVDTQEALNSSCIIELFEGMTLNPFSYFNCFTKSNEESS